MADVRSRIDEAVAEFADLDAREKLELLVEYAAGLPPLDPEHEARKAASEGRIHECQTPVFLWPEVTAEAGARLVADVAPEAPTVKGFVAILVGAVAGRPAAEAADIPDDLLERLGLDDVLGILRSRGLRAITTRVKRGFLG
ncbi:MAG: SufE family protein [Planctomycetota bacterium]